MNKGSFQQAVVSSFVELLHKFYNEYILQMYIFIIFMKFAFISDIHDNAGVLDGVLKGKSEL